MRSALTVSGITLLLWACSSGDAPVPGPMTPSDRQGLCGGIDNFYECSRAVEREQLSGAANAVVRAGDTLIIGLSTGGKKALIDHGQDAEVVLYTYSGFLDGIGYHLVNVHFYEGGAHLLINDATGEETRVAAQPVVSPDRRRLVVASFGGEAGYSPNLLEVWRVTSAGLTVEWEIAPDDWGAGDARWTDANTIEFRKLTPCEDYRACEAPATLRLEAGEWTVTEGPAG